MDPDGYIYIIGNFTQTIIIDDTIVDIGEDLQYDESFIAKFNPGGDLIRFMRSGDNQEDMWLSSLDLDPQNNIIVLGVAIDTVAFGQPLPESASDYYHFVARLNNDFEPIWCIPAQRTMAVKANPESNIYVAGVNNEPITLGDTILDNPGSSFLVKLDPEGSPTWINTMPKMTYMEIERISLDADGNVYLTGEWPGDTLFFQNDTVLFNPHGKSFILKFSEQGDLIWATALEFRFYSYLIDQTGFFYGAYFYRDTYEDGFVIVDNNGDIIYDESFDDMEIQDLSMDDDGNIFYHGWFTGNITIEEEEVIPQTGENYLVGQLKTEMMTSNLNLQEIMSKTDALIYPNPASGRIYFDVPDYDGKIRVTIYDLSGKLMFNRNVKSHSINVNGLTTGYYLVKLHCRDQVFVEKVFIR